MFAFIVVPLLRSLKWINGYVGNYGWSIVILTVIINALMFPLRHKSVVSMRKMQEIQPEAKAIQERYAKLKATDPAKQKMNQELMALYRERGVNPASGCVPMLLTMPVLFAFYALLTTAIELRGAPFFGWIHDLSQPDPYYVTPVLMGASARSGRQWMTPPTGVDPAQQKMMMFMPVVFMFFFLWSPVRRRCSTGSSSNIWGIGQQYLTNYLIGPPNVRTVRPAGRAAGQARRRRARPKRGGARRTDMADTTAADRRVPEPVHRRARHRDARRRRADRRRPAAQSVGRGGRAAGAASRRAAQGAAARRRHGVRPHARTTTSACSSTRSAYRKGKDIELRQMAKLLAEKVKQTGVDQQLGPLNPYERRIVHMAVAEVPGVDDREHRRRVLEDGSHLAAEIAIAAQSTAGGPTPSTVDVLHRPTPSSRSRRRRAAAASASCA